MKKLTTLLFLTAFINLNGICQKTTLSDLTNLCSKKNWEDVNQYLLSQGWTYYDSEKGDSYQYNTIMWSFNKAYKDRAHGWFYLYTYKGLPNKIVYEIFNIESYSLIQNSITSAGFNLVNSEIKDSEVVSTYETSSFKMVVKTEKRKDDDYRSGSMTAYTITLIKKSGIYDEGNGKKTDYYYGDVIKAKYTLKDGKTHGERKTYHYNGKLKMIGSFTNGVENGEFKEYDEYGNIEREYTMSKGALHGDYKTYYPNGKPKKTGSFLQGKEHGKVVEYDNEGNIEAEVDMRNGKSNGKLKIYENGKISYSIVLLNDIEHGETIQYFYNTEKNLIGKMIGEKINGKEDGVWKYVLLTEDQDRVITFTTYKKGVKNGAFQDVKGDSLIIGNYKDNELNGDFRVYFDSKHLFFGGVIRTDTTQLTLIAEGGYSNGLKTGYWKIYDNIGALRRGGRYLNGRQSGEWRYYYTQLYDTSGNYMPYSEELFLVSNFKNGELNGKSVRYSLVEEEKIPCPEEDGNKSTSTCRKYEYHKFLETSFYKNGKLNGIFELKDSANQIIANGSYKDGMKDGEWFHKYSDYSIKDGFYYFYQKGNYVKDKREGEWVEYLTEGKITKKLNYKNGELHGEYTEWNQVTKSRVTKQFVKGEFKSLIIYDDSLGVNPQCKYEIYDKKQTHYKCRRTEYLKNGYISQEYLLMEENINHNKFELNFIIVLANSGYKDGEFKHFNSDDKPLLTGKYSKGGRIDLWVHYFYDQGVIMGIKYPPQDDKKREKYVTITGEYYSGEFTFIDDEKGVKEIRKIKKGLRHGKTVYIDLKTSKTIKKERYKKGVLQ